MTNQTSHKIISKSSQATESIGQSLGKRLKGGETVELISDLGGGKTTFVRGLARGAGSNDHVSSPTFKISNVYKCASGLKIYHFDFYRLNEAGLIASEIEEVLGDADAVVIVEWANVVNEVLPDERVHVIFESVGENERRLSIKAGKKYQYLLEDLC